MYRGSFAGSRYYKYNVPYMLYGVILTVLSHILVLQQDKNSKAFG